MLVGYARVSTLEQNLDMQIQALRRAGCKRIYSEKISGGKVEREEYSKLKEFIRSEEDTIVVYKLDRLGRSLKHLVSEVQWFEEKKIGFKSLQENIDTSSANGKLFFHIFASLAEFEKDLIRERTMAGLKAARARGRKGGRPRKITDEKLMMMRKLYNDKSNEIDDICKTFSISRATLFRLVKV